MTVAGAVPPCLSGTALVERSLAWTRGALAAIEDEEGPRPSPCLAWTLGDLLVHLVDSLEAVAEIGWGRLAVVGPPPASTRPTVLADHLQVLGHAVLDGWVAPGRAVAPPHAGAAALEIAVHGWDIARARGSQAPFPPLLAAALLPVAVRLVPAQARDARFGPPLRPPDSGPAALLLAHLGREVDWQPAG